MRSRFLWSDNNQPYLVRVTLSSKADKAVPSFRNRIGIWSVGFCRGKKTEEPGENPLEQERETQPTCRADWVAFYAPRGFAHKAEEIVVFRELFSHLFSAQFLLWANGKGEFFRVENKTPISRSEWIISARASCMRKLLPFFWLINKDM